MSGVIDRARARIDYDLSRVHQRRGRQDEAMTALERAVARDPSHADWWVRLAGLTGKNRRWQRSADAWAGALALQPDNAAWHYNQGRQLERGRRPGTAAAAYRAAIALDDGQAEWHESLGRVLEHQERWLPALHAYERAVELDPKRAEAHAGRARCLLARNRRVAAAEAYDAALELKDDPQWAAARAEAYEEAGRWRKAAAGYEHIALRHEQTAGPWFRAALMWEAAAEEAALIDALAAGLHRDPTAGEPERMMFVGQPQSFAPRRLMLTWVAQHLDEIRARAAEPPIDKTAGHGPIFIYWAQGFDEAPPIVRLCQEEVRRHHRPEDVMLLDGNNYRDLVELPAVALGKLSDDATRLSDVLRLELLFQRGGMWLDATCLPRANLVTEVDRLLGGMGGFFAFSTRRARLANWLMRADRGDFIVATLRAAHHLYWELSEEVSHYYMFHHMFESLYYLDPKFRSAWEASPRTNVRPSHMFQWNISRDYDPVRYRELLEGSFVHKLTYKFAPELLERPTMIARLLEHGLAELSTDEAEPPVEGAHPAAGDARPAESDGQP